MYGEKKQNYNASQWYDTMLAFFDGLGYQPDYGACSTPNYSPRKAIKLKSLQKKLNSIEFEEIELMSLYATLENFKSLLDGWYVYASINMKQLTSMVCFDNHVQEFDKDMMKKTILDMFDCIDVKYGIAYQRDFNLGPAVYALGGISGLNYDEVDRAERDKITKWLHDSYKNRSYLKGMLRDVYPVNILTDIHLNRDIGDKTLKQWIQEESIGDLYSINNFLWMWVLDNTSINTARSHLAPLGIILCI